MPHIQPRLQRQSDGPGAVAVLNTWITARLGLGALLQEPPREEPCGAEAWLLDPEVNWLQLLVMPAPSSPLHEAPFPLVKSGFVRAPALARSRQLSDRDSIDTREAPEHGDTPPEQKIGVS